MYNNEKIEEQPKPFARGVFTVWLCITLLFLAGLVFFVAKMYGATSNVGEDHQLALPRVETISLASANEVAIPAFTEDAKYLLVAFSLQGMRQITSAPSIWEMTSAGSVFAVQLIERDTTPIVHTKGFTVRYSIEGDNVVEGETREGVCEPSADGLSFVSPSIRLLPTTNNKEFAPFPLVLVQAFDRENNLIASTKLTLPVTTEMGCHNCHQGASEQGYNPNINTVTAMEILTTHDRRNSTTLAAQVAKGQEVNCYSCHSAESSVLNLSAAIHGFHANMQPANSESCLSCHPQAEHSQRDVHASMGFSCSNCHGEMEDHALSLLKAEAVAGKSTARKRLDEITPQSVASVEDITPRAPWTNLPDCTNCHDFVNGASSSVAFNQWTENKTSTFSRRFENTGTIRCASCHGAAHATYEATNPLGDERDNIQPLQYQKLARPLGAQNNCQTCHTVEMEGSVHHDLMEK